MRAKKTSKFVADTSYEEFLLDDMRQYAVFKAFEIDGEAMNRAISAQSEIEEFVPDVRRIISMRNILVHGYDIIDDQVVWETAIVHVPVLKEQIIDSLSRLHSVES